MGMRTSIELFKPIPYLAGYCGWRTSVLSWEMEEKRVHRQNRAKSKGMSG